MPKYIVLFPECKNEHLIKEVGMIPYYFSKNYGYDTEIVCYKNQEDYPYLQKLTGVKLTFLKNTFDRPVLDGLCYLKENAKNINVLQIFHAHSTRNYYWICLFKKLNPEGKIYLKLDTYSAILKESPFGKFPVSLFRMKTLKKCTLISAESEILAVTLSKLWHIQVDFINNGICYDTPFHTKIDYGQKHNRIITVGRIGTNQKATEILLKGFQRFSATNPNWELRIIGNVEPDFMRWTNAFLCQYPALKCRITFLGKITDRTILWNEYLQAKIFCLTSRWESFGFVLAEALSMGCYLISSNIDSVFDISDYGKYASFFPIDDYIGLAKCLDNVCSNEALFKEACITGPSYITAHFNWENSCQKINNLLNGE